MATDSGERGQTINRVPIVHQNFLDRVAAGDLPPGPSPTGTLNPNEAVQLFRAQCLSRALDQEARAMQAAGTGYYTIGSSGHEGMAAVAHALRPTDMAFLHYRDAAFQIARANQLAQPAIGDLLASFACSTEDGISGGRHKVLGSKPLNIPPQTSTIASHLPKAVGAAYSIGAAKRHRPEHSHLLDDSIIVCSFGDASANHATAQSAINAACWAAFQSSPMPILFVCEDNGIGISVKTPKGWIEAAFSQRPELRYITGDGLDLYATFHATETAADYVRTTRRPAFLHLRTVRLFGHAGADVPTSYLPRQEVEEQEANDPLLHSVRLLVDAGVLTTTEALGIYRDTCAQVSAQAAEAAAWPRLETADEVMASLIPPPRITQPTTTPNPDERLEAFGPTELAAQREPQPMGRLLNWALTDLMLEHREVVVMGEDVAQKGGVYGVTQRLLGRFGPDRVIDTLLDETSILGLAIGMAHNGFVPIPEIQFLAYLHNAEDQIRGEAATLPFFSQGQFTNPMVIRIAGLGYQRGFGGHFHNDNSLAVLRDIPGVIVVCPSNGADAARLLREAVRLARVEQRVVVFLEPIAIYPMRDLHQPADGQWMRLYPDPQERIAAGHVGRLGNGDDLAIVTFGNGVHLSHQAAVRLSQHDIQVRIIDLRWLSPLPVETMLAALEGCKRILVVDETRAGGGVSESVITELVGRVSVPVARHAAHDSFIATGPAYAATLPSVDSITEAAFDLCRVQ